MASTRTRAPAFAEVEVLEQRVIAQGQRTWRIAICRHRAERDLVVLFANRDKVYGGARKVLYRGQDAEAARQAADTQLGKGFGRGYRNADGSRAEGFTWERPSAGRRTQNLQQALGRSRSTA